jgi:hypothetical protein
VSRRSGYHGCAADSCYRQHKWPQSLRTGAMGSGNKPKLDWVCRILYCSDYARNNHRRCCSYRRAACNRHSLCSGSGPARTTALSYSTPAGGDCRYRSGPTYGTGPGAGAGGGYCSGSGCSDARLRRLPRSGRSRRGAPVLKRPHRPSRGQNGALSTCRTVCRPTPALRLPVLLLSENV